MKSKIVTAVLSVALAYVNSGQTFGQVSAESKPDDRHMYTESENAVNEKFRAEILKLAADSRTAPIPVKIPRTQIQSQQKNNLSTGAKIAIGVIVAVGVVAAIVLIKRCRNEQGCGAGR